MNRWYFEFAYETMGATQELGRGDLILNEGNIPIFEFEARTGSVNKEGKLINAIPPGIWTGREPSVPTKEPGMVVDRSKTAFKWRLWDSEGNWTHYLFHADEPPGGSLGCVVTDKKYGNCAILYKRIDKIFVKQHIIPVFINMDVPREERDGVS